MVPPPLLFALVWLRACGPAWLSGRGLYFVGMLAGCVAPSTGIRPGTGPRVSLPPLPLGSHPIYISNTLLSLG